MELLHAEGFEEPLSGRIVSIQISDAQDGLSTRAFVHVWTGQLIKGVEAEACVLY